MLDWFFTTLFEPFTNPIDQRNTLSYMAALLFLVVFVVVARLLRRKKGFRPRALARLMFKKTVWLHRSAKLDYKLYALNLLLLGFVLGFFVIGSDFWATHFGTVLTTFFGPPHQSMTDNWWVVALIVVAGILSLDFGYWMGHYAMHKSPLLWEFHKLHHSAEVMTPATEFRQHPIELIFMPCCMGFSTGITYAVLTHFFGVGSPKVGLFGFNLVLLAHLLTFHHLRHSHINMPFTGIFGRVLHSPMHHIIHHSDNPKHFDRNLGYMFSIWDWMAGTLYVPRKGERVTLGIGHEGATHDTVAHSLWYPVRNAARILSRRYRRLTGKPASKPVEILDPAE